ncbi:MFS transporter [Porticoccus sp.]
MSARQRVVLTLGLTQTLAWGSTYYLPAILAEPIANQLNISTGHIFGAFSMALILAALFGPVAGQRIDELGGRPVLVTSNLLFATGLLVLGLAQGLASIWLAWALIGIGMAVGLYESAFATLTGLYGHQARGPITTVTLIAGFASTVCWPITGWMDAEFGWRTACFIWSAAHLFIGLPLNLLLLPKATQAKEQAPETLASQTTPPRFAMPLLALAFAIIWILSTAMAAHLPRLLQETGLSPTAAIGIAALVGPAQVAARFLEFSLFKHLHPITSSRLASVAHPLGALAVLWFSAPAAALFSVLHGAGNGILTIAKGTLPLAIFGPHGYGKRQGWLMAPARFGQAFAPFLFALLIDRFGSGALAVSATLSLLTFSALTLLQHLIKKESETSTAP